MLKKSASFQKVKAEVKAEIAAALLGTRRVSARQGWAGEKSGLFGHPAWHYPIVLEMGTIEFTSCRNSFSADS